MSERRVFLVCTDDETAKDVGDCLKRVSAVMSATYTYMDVAADLDTEAPDFEEKLGPILLRKTKTIVELYPNGPGRMEQDIKSIGDFTVRKI